MTTHTNVLLSAVDGLLQTQTSLYGNERPTNPDLKCLAANAKTELVKQLRLIVDNPPTPKKLPSNQKYARSFHWENNFKALRKVESECID